MQYFMVAHHVAWCFIGSTNGSWTIISVWATRYCHTSFTTTGKLRSGSFLQHKTLNVQPHYRHWPHRRTMPHGLYHESTISPMKTIIIFLLNFQGCCWCSMTFLFGPLVSSKVFFCMCEKKSREEKIRINYSQTIFLTNNFFFNLFFSLIHFTSHSLVPSCSPPPTIFPSSILHFFPEWVGGLLSIPTPWHFKSLWD